jgi:uncharacterized protein (TIGR02117 family)
LEPELFLVQVLRGDDRPIMSRRRLAFACLALGTLAAACSAPQPLAPRGDAVVYVVGRGWHTDIGLPVEEIAGPLATLENAYPGVRFLSFGFGERQFLVDRKKTFGAMLKALLPSPSALLMTALRTTPEDAFGQPNVVVLHVSRAELDRIEASLWSEFELTPAGEPLWLAEGPYEGSSFYAARDTYYGLFTCNTWTASILRQGGLPMSATGILFSGQVMGLARWMGARQAVSPKD